TLKDIEVICVDDGSTDSSLSILKEYSEKDSRFRYITKKNSGYGNTMNLGMASATGEYIGIVESDDYVEKHMFSDLYETAKKVNADIVKSDYYEFSTKQGRKHKEYIHTVHEPSFYGKVIKASQSDAIMHFKMNTWTGIYKNSFIKSNNIRHNETPGASYQDNGFWFQTLTLAERMVFVNKAYYYYRQDNPNSSINNKGKVFCMCDEYAYIEKFMRAHPRVESRFSKVFLVKKYFNYMYTYGRIADEYKIDFLKRFADEFRASKDAGEFDDTLLYPNDMAKLKRIMKDPEQFYYDDTIWCLNRKYTELSDRRNWYNIELEEQHGRR
ncbi:MAG: glycosyltransferase family 2 protein, partial [Eubacteriales bacterium]